MTRGCCRPCFHLFYTSSWRMEKTVCFACRSLEKRHRSYAANNSFSAEEYLHAELEHACLCVIPHTRRHTTLGALLGCATVCLGFLDEVQDILLSTQVSESIRELSNLVFQRPPEFPEGLRGQDSGCACDSGHTFLRNLVAHEIISFAPPPSLSLPDL